MWITSIFQINIGLLSRHNSRLGNGKHILLYNYFMLIIASLKGYVYLLGVLSLANDTKRIKLSM